MAKRQTAAERGISYANKRPAEDWLLAHNHVRPEADTPHGWQGFRRFWVSPEKMKELDWLLCKCGWRPDLGPHTAGWRRKWISEPSLAARDHVGDGHEHGRADSASRPRRGDQGRA